MSPLFNEGEGENPRGERGVGGGYRHGGGSEEQDRKPRAELGVGAGSVMCGCWGGGVGLAAGGGCRG